MLQAPVQKISSSEIFISKKNQTRDIDILS